MARLTLPRRHLLQGASAIAGGIVAGVRPRLGLAKPKLLPLYQLSPFYDDTGEPHCGGCSACNACIKHAQNKVFATSDAADNGRAHVNCDCAIVSHQVPYGSWVLLFGNPSHPRTLSRDRRERQNFLKWLAPLH